MRMKVKTYGINFLILGHLRLNSFSRKRRATKKFIPYVLTFILILKYIYKQGVFVTKKGGVHRTHNTSTVANQPC